VTRRAHVAAFVVAAVVMGCAGDDGADPEAFCATAERVANDPVLLDPELSTEQLDRLAASYDEMADTAPGSVRDDVEFLNDAAHKLQEGDISFAVDDEQSARLAAAFEAVSDYVREDCQ
jgi:hypothetical protein